MFSRKILFALIAALFSFSENHAQFTGKPRYQILTTRAGNFLGITNVELYPLIAPLTVKNFDSLVSTSFFDTTAFHRVIPNFMIQGGDPNSRHGPKSTWGYGDPSQPTVPAEFSILSHQRGILSMARDTGINSANSQFFICVANDSWLDNQYSIFGHVISGMNIVDTIVNEARDANDCPFQKIEMFVTYTGSNDTIPNAPVLNTPLSGTQNVGINKLLKWNAEYGAVIYHIDVATDSLFANIFKAKDVTTPYYTVTQLQGSTTYYWRVKTNNGGHWSPGWSSVWNFSTTMNSGVNNLAFTEKGYRLEQNIPNPSNGQTVIKYFVPAKEKIVIKLFDIEGNEIAVPVNEEKAKGEFSISVDMSRYAAGTYFYRMEAGNVSDTKKLVLEK